MKLKINKPHLLEIQRMSNPGGERIRTVRLDKNERTVPFPKEFWTDILNDLSAEWPTVYPEVVPLIEAIARFDGVKSDQVFLTAGSDVAIKSCFEAFIRPGDEVVFLAPTFAMVEVYLKLFQAKAKPVMTLEQFKAPVTQLVDTINPNTSLVYIANPNSPSGTEVSLLDLEKVISKAAQFGVPVLVDEAYFFFTEVTAIPLVEKYANLVVARTFSKAWGIAGLRLGYAVGQKEVIDLVSKWRPMYEVNSLAVLMGQKLLKNPEIMRAYVEQVLAAKRDIYDWAIQKEIAAYPSGANFVNIRLGKKNVNAVVELALREGILVKNAGSGEGAECLRISAGIPNQVRRVLDIAVRILGS